jgi:acyl-CoA synthetase (AMP-forming)/AMP-acid ligase II
MTTVSPEQPIRSHSSGPVEPATLAEMLAIRAATTPDEIRFRFLGNGEETTATLTYAQIDRAARALAADLALTADPGDRALLLYAPGLDFVTAFYGCLYAGIIAIPVAPPQLSKLQIGLGRLASITRNSAARLLLTSADIEAQITPVLAEAEDLAPLRVVATDRVPADAAEGYVPPSITADSVAYLQYSSGSTGEPKGVILTHRNVLANVRLIAEHTAADADSVGVTWLPTFHDMGLLMGVMQPVYSNRPIISMSPMAFVRRPIRWIGALSRFGATHTVAPNFAFELAVRRISADQAKDFDLSRLKAALCGAEPIRADTMNAFAAHFALTRFDPNSLFPCYGLAEATVFVTGGPVGTGMTALQVDPVALTQGEVKVRADAGRRLVASGRLNDGFELVVTDPASAEPAPPGRVGEVCISGESIGIGYWAAPEASAATFGTTIADHDGRFLRTGDLGFVHEGRLYITGRLKDLIIVDGSNHYSTDIEHTVMTSHPAVRPDRCAAFQVIDDDVPRLVLVTELATHTADRDEVAAAARQAVGERHSLRLDDIVLVTTGSIPMTSSGKIRRYLLRKQYRDGTLAVLS